MMIEDIEKRLAEIKNEITADGANVAELSTEADTLIEQRAAMLKDIEERKATLNKIAEGAGEVTQTFAPEGKENRNMEFTKDTVFGTKEYRSAWAKSLRGLALDEVETRALTTAGTSAVIPTELADEIISKVRDAHPILNEVTMLAVKGAVKFAVEGTNNAAAVHTEGATINDSADTLTSVTLSTYEIVKKISISGALAEMSAPAFEAWIVEMLSAGIADKVADLMINGTGSSQPQGMVTGATAKTYAATNPTAAEVLDLMGSIAYENVKFCMNRKTLFTQYLPLQDKNKNDLVAFANGRYYIQGVEVILDSKVADNTALYGDFRKYVADMPAGVEVHTGYDINTNSNVYLGVGYFDGKVALKEAIANFKKNA